MTGTFCRLRPEGYFAQKVPVTFSRLENNQSETAMHASYSTLQLLLAAGENRAEYLTRGFRQRPTRVDLGEVFLGVGIVVAFLLALWLLSRLVDYRQQRGPRNSRLGLFFSLCKAHGLEWRDWWLLWRVARRHRLRDPARVFLEPERLQFAGLGRGFRSQQGRLQALTQRLFAGLRYQ